MMFPVVKTVLCADYEANPAAFVDGNFSTSIEVEIGPKNSEGADLFQFNVRSLKNIADEIESNCYAVIQNVIIVESIDYSQLKVIINKIIERAQASSWGDVVAKIKQFGHYEFS